MSLQFNDTSTYRGIVQTFEDEAGFNPGDVSGNSTLLARFTSWCNLALDDFVEMAIKSSGTWQWDDSNHTDYPIITTNLVSAQRDYSFTTDEDGNLILDIYRVLVADSDGNFHELQTVDQQTATADNGSLSMVDGSNQTGIPNKYDKTGNGIFLDPIPNYNYTNGLKVFINREAYYFTSADTTRKPGIPGVFHKYLALKPAMDYARRNGLANYNQLAEAVMIMEQNIKDYFSLRPKDEARRLKPLVENNK